MLASRQYDQKLAFGQSTKDLKKWLYVQSGLERSETENQEHQPEGAIQLAGTNGETLVSLVGAIQDIKSNREKKWNGNLVGQIFQHAMLKSGQLVHQMLCNARDEAQIEETAEVGLGFTPLSTIAPADLR